MSLWEQKVETAEERAERIANKPAKKPKRPRMVGGRMKGYLTFRAELVAERLGSACDQCGKKMERTDEMVLRHLVRRQHRQDLVEERENVRVTCAQHRSVEDYDFGRHTTNEERIVKIGLLFGSRAAKYAREKMEERGLLCEQ